ncbi:MAG: ABC transporter ATP-binding protein [Proteobacteria bacterium]|nr:ABC transporter ATP-binding protein [Pseudomonadota bacterium]
MMLPLLEIKNLKAYFFVREGIAKAVDGVDLAIQKGETLALVGESGCGKSVTAYSILRLIPSPPGKIIAGEILFEGENILLLPENKLRELRGNKIAMVFQDPLTSLNPVFRIGNQVAEVLQVHRNMSKREALEYTISLLKDVGIPSPEQRIRNYPHQMSGGMRQRVMIAMALACEPQLIIADEPTTALDVTVQAQILDLLRHLKNTRDMALFLITHDLGVVAETAQNVAVMYAGRIMEYTDVISLFKNPLNPYTKGLLSSMPQSGVKRLTPIKGMVPPILNLPEGCKFNTRCPHTFDKCLQGEPLLINIEKDKNKKHLVRCWLYA